jgi:hypothetical protein
MAYKIKPLTKKKTDYFIADETKAEKEYHRFGFHSIARDEGKHKKYFQRIKEQRF